MTIEYKDSKRIVLDTSATFEDDDFAGWTVQSRASVTAGVLFTPDSNYANAHITHSFKTYAIGEPDKFVFNWDWKFSGLKLPFVAITSEASAGQASSSNAGGYGNPTEGNKKIIFKNNDQTMSLNFRSYKTGGSNFNEDADSSTATTTNGTMYYYQCIKDGYSISWKRYGSIADRTAQTNAQQTVTTTWNAGSTTGGWTDTADLAYIVIGSYGNYQNVGFANAGSNYTYDFKFYSGVTTPPAKPTDVQDNSILVEKDTAKRYWRTPALAPTYETDFSSSAGWTENTTTASDIDIDTANNRVYLNLTHNSSETSVLSRTLPTTSDTAWVLRFKVNATSVGTDGSLLVGLSTNASASDTQQRFLGFWFKELNSSALRAVTDDNNNAGGLCAGNNTTGYTGTPSSGTDYYVTIVRDVNNIKVTTRTGSHTGTAVGSGTVTTAVDGTATGLNTLKIMNQKCSTGGAWIGYLYDLEFYNAVTSVTPATWIRFPPFAPTRGIFAGGTSTDIIEYITIATLGNATDFGDLSADRVIPAGVSSETRGLIGGGNTSGISNIIEYVTIATPSNSIDFGDLSQARNNLAGASDTTKGVFAGGDPQPSDSNVIDYVTIATTGNATDFGDLTQARRAVCGLGNDTRGVFGGGATALNTIDYITIATTGNATDFGDLSVGRRSASTVSSATRGCFGGGSTGSNSDVIDYITIATGSNATDFGNLTVARQQLSAVTSYTRGCFAGGSASGDTIDYITIDTLGNATDFGNLTLSRTAMSSTGVWGK